MQRHRNESIRMLKAEQKLGQEQFRERGHIIESMTEFERLERRVDGKGIQEGRARTLKRRRPQLAGCTVDVQASRYSHRLVASPAGIRNARQVRTAAETEMAECFSAAKDAAVGQGAADNGAGQFSQQTAGALAVTGHRGSVTGRGGDFRRRKQPFRGVMTADDRRGER